MLRTILLAVCLVLASTSAVGARMQTLACNAIYGVANFHSQGAMLLADKVRTYTSGSVDITVHPGGSMGFKGPELLQAVQEGTVPMSDILMGVVAGADDVFGLSSLPLIVKSYDQARAYYTRVKPAYEAALARWNQKLLYAAPWPPSGLITAQKITTLADLRELKVRTYDSNGAAFLEKAGAASLSMPWGALYAALSTKRVDSILTSAVSARDLAVWEVLGHFTKINFAYPLNMVVINLDAWKALEPDQQLAMLRAAAETETYQWKASRASNEEALRVMAERGMAIADVDPVLGSQLDMFAAELREEFLSHASAHTREAYAAMSAWIVNGGVEK